MDGNRKFQTLVIIKYFFWSDKLCFYPKSEPFDHSFEQLEVHEIRQESFCEFDSTKTNDTYQETNKCECAEGFIEEKEGMCLDVNECVEFEDICEGLKCFNLPGSYECRQSSLENVLGYSTVKSNGRPVFLGNSWQLF